MYYIKSYKSKHNTFYFSTWNSLAKVAFADGFELHEHIDKKSDFTFKD